MKITRKDEHYITLQDLNYGDVFEYDGDYYMTINGANDTVNAINLRDGALRWIGTAVPISLVDHELIIK